MSRAFRIAFNIALIPLLLLAVAAGPTTAPGDAEIVGEHVTPEQIRQINPPPQEGFGRRVVFVCDASASMKLKWEVVKEQLDKSVIGLRPNQKFNILIFQENGCFALDAGDTLFATPENKKLAKAFLDGIHVGGKTDPLSGLELAFKLKPQIIYLLADHDFPDNEAVLKKIHDLNVDKKIKVNAIAIVGTGGPSSTTFIDLMKKIADDGVGRYRELNVDELKDAPATEPAAGQK